MKTKILETCQFHWSLSLTDQTANLFYKVSNTPPCFHYKHDEVWSCPSKIPINGNVFLKKVIPRSVRQIWSTEKWNVKLAVLKIGQSWLVCKQYLWPVVFPKPPKILPARGSRSNKKNEMNS